MKTSTAPYSTASQDEIACRAREIWNARGCPDGCDVEIWLEAERQLTSPAPVAAALPANSPVNVSAKPARKARTSTAISGKSAPRARTSNTIDDRNLADRLDDFGEPPRRSATSVDLT
jgi:hypothetical protein